MAGERESTQILIDIYKSMRGDGIPKETYEGIKHLLVAPGTTVRDYIDVRRDFGDIVWREVGDKTVLIEDR